MPKNANIICESSLRNHTFQVFNLIVKVCEKGRKITVIETIALCYLLRFSILVCGPATCTGANRECKDGECACEDGYQEIVYPPEPIFPIQPPIKVCEKGRKIKDINKTQKN